MFLAEETGDFRSVGGILVGVYIVVVFLLLVHVVAVLWPPPVISSNVIETLERETQNREEAVRLLTQSLLLGPAPAGLAADQLRTRRTDSARLALQLRNAQFNAQAARDLTDSLRAERTRTVLNRTNLSLFGKTVFARVSLDLRLVLLAMALGALGAFVHAAQSYATYVGNRTLRLSWAWWYLLRPGIGAALAAILYFAVRGALFPSSVSVSGDISPFGVAAIATLAGMFSKQAVDKLNELFTTLFRTGAQEGDAIRKDRAALGAAQEGVVTAGASSVAEASPRITAVKQDPVPAQGGELAILVTGEHFPADAAVHVDRVPITTTRLSDTELRGTVLVQVLRGSGPFTITVAGTVRGQRRESNAMPLDAQL